MEREDKRFGEGFLAATILILIAAGGVYTVKLIRERNGDSLAPDSPNAPTVNKLVIGPPTHDYKPDSEKPQPVKEEAKEEYVPIDGDMAKWDDAKKQWIKYEKPEPRLGFSATDKEGHPWMMYYDSINLPMSQIRVVDGTTFEVLTKDGEHGFYIKLNLFTHFRNDWVAKLVIEKELKDVKYEQLYAKVIHTFPDGDRICSVRLAIDKAGNQYLDLDKALLDTQAAFKTQEEANKHYEDNKGKGPDAASLDTDPEDNDITKPDVSVTTAPNRSENEPAPPAVIEIK